MELVDTTIEDVKTVHDFFVSAPALDSKGVKIRVLEEFVEWVLLVVKKQGGELARRKTDNSREAGENEVEAVTGKVRGRYWGEGDGWEGQAWFDHMIWCDGVYYWSLLYDILWYISGMWMQ